MKVPFVKEWGSWAVMGSSSVAALIAGLLARPGKSGRHFTVETILTVAGIGLLLNAKNPLASLIRTRGRNSEHIIWFLVFVISGMLFMIPFLSDGVNHFLPFSLLAVTYAIFLWRGREHHVLAELNGFALLTLSAPVIYFVVTGNVSVRLYAAVTLFFGAGVFKVRMRLRKALFFRIVMIAWCSGAAALYYLMGVSLLLLLPLMENIISALWLRAESLRATGNIELTKSVVFVILLGFFWH